MFLSQQEKILYPGKVYDTFNNNSNSNINSISNTAGFQDPFENMSSFSEGSDINNDDIYQQFKGSGFIDGFEFGYEKFLSTGNENDPFAKVNSSSNKSTNDSFNLFEGSTYKNSSEDEDEISKFINSVHAYYSQNQSLDLSQQSIEQQRNSNRELANNINSNQQELFYQSLFETTNESQQQWQQQQSQQREKQNLSLEDISSKYSAIFDEELESGATATEAAQIQKSSKKIAKKSRSSSAEKTETKTNPKKNAIGLIRNRIHHILEEHFIHSRHSKLISKFIAIHGREEEIKSFTQEYNEKKNRKWTHNYSWNFLFELIESLSGGQAFFEFVRFFLSKEGSEGLEEWISQESLAFQEKKSYFIEQKSEILRNLHKNFQKFKSKQVN